MIKKTHVERALIWCGILICMASCATSIGGRLDYFQAEQYLSNNQTDMAISSYKLACEKGYGKACYELFKIYYEGRHHIRKDRKTAFRYLNKAAALKDDNALVIKGQLHQSGMFGFKKDPAKAYECFVEAAKKENYVAYYDLGFMYLFGLYPEQDTSKALEYFRLAKANGMPVHPALLDLRSLDRIAARKSSLQSARRALVRKIQTKLKKLGYYNARVDGLYGPKTRQAILDFQKAYGFPPDGKARKKTLEQLKSVE